MIEPVVVAEKTMYRGAMFGHISNCGGSIDLGNGKSIKFIGVNDKFLKLQLLEHGLGIEVKTSSWQKTKTVTVKDETQTKIKPEKVKGVIEVADEVGRRDLF